MVKELNIFQISYQVLFDLLNEDRQKEKTKFSPCLLTCRDSFYSLDTMDRIYISMEDENFRVVKELHANARHSYNYSNYNELLAIDQAYLYLKSNFDLSTYILEKPDLRTGAFPSEFLMTTNQQRQNIMNILNSMKSDKSGDFA